MSSDPRFDRMTDAERAAWHEARRSERQTGRVVRRHTGGKAEAHLSIRLYPEQMARLRELSQREGWTISALVRRFVEERLDQLVPRETPTVGSGRQVWPNNQQPQDTETVGWESVAAAGSR
jgi:hypothetical protein